MASNSKQYPIFKVVVALGYMFYGFMSYMSPNSGTPAMVTRFFDGRINGQVAGVFFILSGFLLLLLNRSPIRIWQSSIPMLLYAFIVAAETFVDSNASLTPVAGLLFICALIWAYVYENLGN